MNGELSDEQLEPAADLADEDTDEEITERAKHASPVELQRMARDRRRAAREDSVKRRNRRSLRKWVDDDGFLCGRFELPLEHGGAIVEAFFDQVTQRMKPATGEAWEPLDRRQADVLIGLCQLEAGADDRAEHATVGARVDVHVDITLDGEATMCGVALPDEWVDAARANARVHLRVMDDDGNVIAEDRARTFVSQKRRRAVVRRDGRCRWPGCNRRLRLQVHHLHPSSWGGIGRHLESRGGLRVSPRIVGPARRLRARRQPQHARRPHPPSRHGGGTQAATPGTHDARTVNSDVTT